MENDGKVYRNIQEQVGKNQDDIARLKSGIVISFDVDTSSQLSALMTEENIGKYVYHTIEKHLYVITRRNTTSGIDAIDLGEFPFVAKGETGETGPQGPIGTRGPSLFGVSHVLPSATAYIEGDMYLLDTGNLYKVILDYFGNKTWILQTNIRGPQGEKGSDGDEVQANPSSSATAYLYKISIDGIVYSFPIVISQEDREMLDNLEEYVEWDEDGSATFGHDIYADGMISAGTDVEVGRKLVLRGTGTAADIVDEDGNPIDFGSGTNDYSSLLNKPKINNIELLGNKNLSELGIQSNLGFTPENVANKKTTIDSQSSDIDYPSAKCVYDNLQNVMEVAEGKKQNYVLSYNATPPTEQTFQYYHLYRFDGTLIETWADFQTYVSNQSCVNSVFNSQNNTIQTISGYLLIDKLVDAPYSTYLVLSYNDIYGGNIKVGDTFYIKELDVPDRWYYGFINFEKLETSKVDLNNYFTKTECNNTFAKLGSSQIFTERQVFSFGDVEIREASGSDIIRTWVHTDYIDRTINDSGYLSWQFPDHSGTFAMITDITKEQVGLSNVDNTSDLDKPISTSTQEALDLKQDKIFTYNPTVKYDFLFDGNPSNKGKGFASYWLDSYQLKSNGTSLSHNALGCDFRNGGTIITTDANPQLLQNYFLNGDSNRRGTMCFDMEVYAGGDSWSHLIGTSEGSYFLGIVFVDNTIRLYYKDHTYWDSAELYGNQSIVGTGIHNFIITSQPQIGSENILIRVYIDGILSNSIIIASGLHDESTKFSIGARYNNGTPSGFSKGYITNLKFFTESFTNDDVQRYYADGRFK